MPTTLLSLILSSVCHGAFHLLNGHCHLEASHLRHQQIGLRSSSRLLLHELLLGLVNPTNSFDQTLMKHRLHFLGGLQLPLQVTHLCLYPS